MKVEATYLGNYGVGSTVRLVSGGPRMTVIAELDEKSVRCIWFAEPACEQKTACEGSFLSAVLVET